jgi:rhodanese-related sulfurtransferase
MAQSINAVKINRRKMLFKILRVATSKLITGNYHFPAVSEITAKELNDHLDSDEQPIVVDTRSEVEFNSGFGHIPGSRLIPIMDMVGSFNDTDEFKGKVKQLEQELEEIVIYKDHEVITICPGGGFSLVAAEIMSEAGFENVRSLKGGIDGWYKNNYPTTTEQLN